jgi:hypothetical protein
MTSQHFSGGRIEGSSSRPSDRTQLIVIIKINLILVELLPKRQNLITELLEL